MKKLFITFQNSASHVRDHWWKKQLVLTGFVRWLDYVLSFLKFIIQGE